MFKTVCKAAALAAMAGTVMGDGKPSRRDELAARKVALAEEMAALESEMALAPAAPAADAVVPAPATPAAPAAIAEADAAEVELAESAAVAEAFPEPEGAAPTELEVLRQQIAELEAKAEMDRLKKQLAELKAATPGEAEAAPAPSPAPKSVVADAEPATPLPAAEAEATPAPSPAPKSAVADAEPVPPLPAEAALSEAAPVEAAEPKPDEAPAPHDPEATAPPFVGPANKLEASAAEEQKEEPAPAADGRLEELRALRNGEPKKARSERRAANAKARQDRAARKAQLGSTVPLRDTATGSEEQQIERMQTITDDRAEARRKRAERLRSLRSLRNGGHGDMPAGLPTEDADAEAGPGIGSVLGFSAVVLAMLGVGAYGLKSKMAGSRVRRDSFASNSSRSSMGGVATQLVTSVQNVTGLTSRRNNRISLGV